MTYLGRDQNYYKIANGTHWRHRDAFYNFRQGVPQESNIFTRKQRLAVGGAVMAVWLIGRGKWDLPMMANTPASVWSIERSRIWREKFEARKERTAVRRAEAKAAGKEVGALGIPWFPTWPEEHHHFHAPPPPGAAPAAAGHDDHHAAPAAAAHH